ncbi:hypothetical protein C7974DRAFT_72917 [Boeremia exigua]|uniref:uncharacterized protein n=1 Tax=Boeremia exigua TaxID=749465 RepID=UPI001E8DE58D|nr:uncharacterized protein C7974DRAFT_72917 [Boeremia exigua]KAH6614220.1 hypothetical protein C7974DRAFT_72917 [Boeremia exigua]
MHYAEQPTPPFNSPYQTHASRSNSLLEPPYLSPRRDESMPKYPQGLGLYTYHHQVHTTLPPSPSPSDSWSSHVSSGASPLVTHAIADPYASGAFEHPIVRSPHPWEGAQLSPRSSISSAAIVPVYPHTGRDDAYHDMNQGMGAVNQEGHGWPHDVRYAHNGSTLPSLRQQPMTVAPERLLSTMLPYENAYNSPPQASLEPTPTTYVHQTFLRGPSESSTASRTEFPRASNHSARPQRARNSRHTSPSDALFYCTPCKKGFARNFNYRQHLETHNKSRPRPHVCYYEDCKKGFFRKTDLDRHHKSVHLKTKDEKCHKCPSVFSRKDTCDRHMRDGCPRRREVSRHEVSEYRARL